MWYALFSNFAMIAAMILCLQLVADRLGDMRSTIGRLTLGYICGSAVCISMLVAPSILSGFVFDLRGPLVACAAFFGGWIAVIPAVVMAAFMRFYVGGAGIEAGILGIVATASAGLALRHLWRDRDLTLPILAMVAAGTTTASFSGYLLIPADRIATVLQTSFVPVTLFNVVTTFILSSLLRRENQRFDLLSQNRIYRQMVDALPDAMNAKDAEGRFVAVNPATAELMGAASPADLIGRTDSDFYAAEESAEFRALERQVMAAVEPQVVDQKIVVDGKDPLWVSTQKIPLVSDGGNVEGVITHNRDVTADRALSEMKAQFVATVSHELRTPLTSVRGSLAMISGMDQDAMPPNVHKLHDIAHRNSERLSHLLDDLLDAEKITCGGLEFELADHPIATLVEAALPGLRHYLPSQDVKIAFVNDAPDAVASVEPGRFEQVLSNLVSNAIKFSRKGGIVTVGLSRGNGTILLSVSDTGQGIPDAFKHRVFDAFDQAKAPAGEPQGSTGLGLHIAKVMVEKMGGTIRFFSEEGTGTTFYVNLPDRTDDVGTPPAAAASSSFR